MENVGGGNQIKDQRETKERNMRDYLNEGVRVLGVRVLGAATMVKGSGKCSQQVYSACRMREKCNHEGRFKAVREHMQKVLKSGRKEGNEPGDSGPRACTTITHVQSLVEERTFESHLLEKVARPAHVQMISSAGRGTDLPCPIGSKERLI